MKLETANYYCRRIRLRPHHNFSCQSGDGPGEGVVAISFVVPDSRTGEPFKAVWTGHPFDLASMHTIEEFLLEVVRTITSLDAHEVLETLRYRDKPVWLAHRPGEEKVGLTKPDQSLFFLNRDQ